MKEKPGNSNKKPPEKPRTKEDAIRQMVRDDPQKAAELLRAILRGK